MLDFFATILVFFTTICLYKATFLTAFLAAQILMSVIEIISCIVIVACSTACVTINIVAAVIMAIFDMALQYASELTQRVMPVI